MVSAPADTVLAIKTAQIEKKRIQGPQDFRRICHIAIPYASKLLRKS